MPVARRMACSPKGARDEGRRSSKGWSAARKAMESADRRVLVSSGVKAADALLLIGKVCARRDGDLYVPDRDGLPAFVMPVLVDYADTPESPCPAQATRFGDLVDLVAW